MMYIDVRYQSPRGRGLVCRGPKMNGGGAKMIVRSEKSDCALGERDGKNAGDAANMSSIGCFNRVRFGREQQGAGRS